MIDKLNGQKEYTIVKELHRGGFGITYLAKGIVNDGNIPHECNYTIKELFISKYCKRNMVKYSINNNIKNYIV